LKEFRRTVPLVQSWDEGQTLELASMNLAAHQHGQEHMIGALLIVQVVNKIAERIKNGLAFVYFDSLENM
jgi:hypothetical protein